MGLLNLLSGMGGDPWAGFREVGKQTFGAMNTPQPGQIAPMQQAPQMGGSLQQLVDAWIAMNKPGGPF